MTKSETDDDDVDNDDDCPRSQASHCHCQHDCQGNLRNQGTQQTFHIAPQDWGIIINTQ